MDAFLFHPGQYTKKKNRTKNRKEQTQAPGGEVLPSNGLLGMCRWMGLHFHDSTDYNGVAFFRHFASKKIICPKVTKMGFIIGHKIDQK